MSMFNKANNFSIHGSTFNSVGKKGLDLLYEHTAPGAFHNSSERYDPPKCHPQTRVAVIQAIIDWIEDGQKTSFIKWVYGPAGAGKSAIMQEIAELYHQSELLAASFFWSRSSTGRNTEERLIASLAYQLIIAIPQMRVHVEEAVENDPSVLSRSLAAQMESLIVKPLEKISLYHQQGPAASENPKLIILDGLDECETATAQEYILKIISNAVNQFHIPLIFLIASRPEQAIRDSFNNHSLRSITAQIVLDDKYHPVDDIRLFLVESFESVKLTHMLHSLLPHVWPIAGDIDRLVYRSSGQFIYAATVVKFIRTPSRRPDEQLKIILGIAASGKDDPFAELNALYCQIFSLVEDLPRALDILSCVFLYGESSENIQTLLSYSSGSLQLILINLHSVVHVPPIGDEDDRFHVYHASLQEFLMNPARAGKFYIDKGKAHARIAQHILRYIRKYSPEVDVLARKSTEPIHHDLESHCSQSSATRELLADFFDFDFVKWVSMWITADTFDLDLAISLQFYADNLYTWIRNQETNVLEYFGPGKSLYTHHSHSWEVIVDFLCKEICRLFLKEHPESHQSARTAFTHPQFFLTYGARPNSALLRAVGVPLDIDYSLSVEDAPKLVHSMGRMVELKKFLRDPKRAGRYFVHGGMFASLSLQIFKFIFECKSNEYREAIEEKTDGRKTERNDAETSDDEDNIDDEHDMQDDLLFAIGSLPFYLSNSDYIPELARHASDLLDHKIEANQIDLRSEIEQLHDAIDLYLKRRPTSESNTHQQQSRECAPDNQIIDLVITSEPEERVDAISNLIEEIIGASSDPSKGHLLAEKRRRNTAESVEVLGAIAHPASPSPSPFKRPRVMNPINPTTGSQPSAAD